MFLQNPIKWSADGTYIPANWWDFAEVGNRYPHPGIMASNFCVFPWSIVFETPVHDDVALSGSFVTWQ